MSWIIELVPDLCVLLADIWNAVVHLRSLEMLDPTKNRP